jgi:hypothetical protein
MTMPDQEKMKAAYPQYARMCTLMDNMEKHLKAVEGVASNPDHPQQALAETALKTMRPMMEERRIAHEKATDMVSQLFAHRLAE